MAYDSNLTFTLGKNNKGDNPRRPDYRGELIMDGKTYTLSGWIRSRTGDPTKKFISGKVQLKESKVSAPSEGFEVEKRADSAPKAAPQGQIDPDF